MINAMDGVRGEVKEYTWGQLWWDGTKQFNNGALQYADGTLEFDGLTFYPDGLVIDATGQRVGLLEQQGAELDVTDADETEVEGGLSSVGAGNEQVELEGVADGATQEVLDESAKATPEEVDDVESFPDAEVGER
ncbi:hypothetical protein SAMN04487857_10441 [Pseudomonas sp. ok272]|uniref:hypothetical protein n=1 Tax=unclassified Pseudomonas TaxID=196821 RepID=UPI0008AC6852|nr:MULTISPECIES: hypothetical protein [unclassified Pseudomonas]SEM68505.1 hypothetical protein SAMN04487857_10441 [Pseudomonas sp. ok272]SFM57272.1 hypothetical protein SAMN04487858_10441 [Pseudomonas sp. ok602]